MKFFAGLVIFLLAAGFSSAYAQQNADDQYLYIYTEIQQADGLADFGRSQQALAEYIQAQMELQKFEKIFPTWNPNIVKFRLKYLAGKIADMTGKLPPPVTNPPARAITVTNALPERVAPRSDAELEALRGQVLQLQADNTTLAAKLKEALSVQPATIDSRELARAQQQIQSLMKENELLKTSLSQSRSRTNIVTIAGDAAALKELQAALASANQKLTTQIERADRLELENLALQSRVQTLMASPDSLDALRAENALLRKQIADLKLAAAQAPNIKRMEYDVKQAQLQVVAFKSQNQIWQLEKAALETRLKQSQQVNASKPVSVPAAPLAADSSKDSVRIRELTQERDDLHAQLSSANQKLSVPAANTVSAQIATLTDEIATLRARLAVDEAKPVPYSAEELALFNTPAPTEATVAQKISPNEMPGDSSALVAQAQSFFAEKQFGRAETNYLKILERDSNNVVVLGNLAAIEMEEGKQADAEIHLKAALALNPNDAYNLSRLGFLEFQQEKYDEALDSLGRAAKLDPRNPEIQNYLGVAFSHKGLRVQAETALRRAIQIDPNNAAAHNNLAVIYLTQKPPLVQLARWHYQKALDAGQPRNPDLEKALGLTP